MIKLSGQGEVGEKGGPRGDLYIVVNVQKHDIFTREGYDVYIEMPIRFTQAALGDKLEVPTLDLKELKQEQYLDLEKKVYLN